MLIIIIKRQFIWRRKYPKIKTRAPNKTCKMDTIMSMSKMLKRYVSRVTTTETKFKQVCLSRRLNEYT